MSTLYDSLIKAFPQFNTDPLLRDQWSEDDSDTLSAFASKTNGNMLQQELERGRMTISLGATAYTAWMGVPNEWNGALIVVPGEFANGLKDVAKYSSESKQEGLSAPVLKRALAIRAMVDEHAAVAVLPNDTLYERNLGFTRDERKKLRSNNGQPIADRLRKLVEGVANPDTVELLGLSQGATTANLYAQHPDTQVDSLTIIEAPDVIGRGKSALARSFIGAGEHFRESSRLSSNQPSGGIRAKSELAQYSMGMLLPNNLSIAPLMARENLPTSIAQALQKQAGVMHVWAYGDNVSPKEVNRAISMTFEDNKVYSSLEVTGDYADHGITSLVPLSIAAIRRARLNKG